ncbi:hypothetical protein PLESTM_000779900 [Pleodorina starrii]|nr:generative cell specific-1 paralog [Pleodorina starrii]GLC38811.1 hypothetical protein PLESTM_000779900 [Pleodorina starrii]
MLATANNASSRTDWMLIDQGMFSMDGKACDKIGTGFPAFRDQQNGCSRAQQTCLSGQLNDLWDADMERIRKGGLPLYMVTQFIGGKEARLNIDGSGRILFKLPVTSNSESVVTVSVAADNLHFTNLGPAPARIDHFRKALAGSDNLQPAPTSANLNPPNPSAGPLASIGQKTAA